MKGTALNQQQHPCGNPACPKQVAATSLCCLDCWKLLPRWLRTKIKERQRIVLAEPERIEPLMFLVRRAQQLWAGGHQES